jgi:hypothetical protein
MTISVLCVMPGSNYYKLPGLDLWDEKRNAYNYNGSNPVICHPPCAQWSKLKSFARTNQQEKDLAIFCLEKIHENGGILEHPAGSALWKLPQVERARIISINQHWFGFPSQKRTWLYFYNVKPLSYPLNFNTPTRTTTSLHSKARSKQPLALCEWLTQCIIQTHTIKPTLSCY